MKVLMVLLKTFPPDIRVEKESRTLLTTGHQVCIIATGENEVVEDCVIDGMRVIRIPMPKGWRGRYHEIKDALLHRDQFWIDHILRIARMVGAEIIHGHDLWVLGNCVLAAKQLKIPVIADLHENWPAAMSLFHPRERWLDHITHPVLFGYKNWARFERRILHKVDRIITVVPEAADRLIRMHGLPREKIAIVSNTEDCDAVSEIPFNETVVQQYTGKFLMTYIGGFESARGLDLVIRNMALVGSRIPNAMLLLLGGGNERHLQKIIHESGAGPFVNIVGWQPLDKVYTYIMKSDICLVPHIRHEHTDNTVPHKLFQYMHMRKPVIVSDCPPLKRIVGESRAGFIFNRNDPASFVNAVYTLAEDSTLRHELGNCGYEAVKRKYNWREDAKVLLKCYSELLQTRSRAHTRASR